MPSIGGGGGGGDPVPRPPPPRPAQQLWPSTPHVPVPAGRQAKLYRSWPGKIQRDGFILRSGHMRQCIHPPASMPPRRASFPSLPSRDMEARCTLQHALPLRNPRHPIPRLLLPMCVGQPLPCPTAAPPRPRSQAYAPARPHSLDARAGPGRGPRPPGGLRMVKTWAWCTRGLRPQPLKTALARVQRLPL